MATGSEVVLGFSYEQYEKISKELDILLPLTDDDWHNVQDSVMDSFVKHQKTLLDIHKKCLETYGFKIFNKSSRKIKDFLICETSEGKREFSPFNLELFYDPDEMGETLDVSTFGIALSGRYFPTFLDWRDAHGTLWPVRFNQELNDMIKIARNEIESKFPIFEEANICVIERFY